MVINLLWVSNDTGNKCDPELKWVFSQVGLTFVIDTGTATGYLHVPVRSATLEKKTINQITMTATKLGIWMDHEQAHLIEFTADPMTTTTVNSKFTHTKEEGESKGENNMHNKQQHQQGAFYKELGERIRKYKEVILFGPTSAKSELANSLRDNHLFDSIKIEIESAEKMTDNQSHAFVKKHFSKH